MLRTKLWNVLLVSSLLLFASCSPKVKTKLTKMAKPLGDNATVVTLFPSQNQPIAEQIGTFRVGERGLTIGCTYDVIMRMARIDARQKGANIVHIERIKEPSGGSTCFTFFGSYYKVPDIYAFQDSLNAIENEITKQVFNGDTSYAIVHIYRPRSGYGWAVNYKMHLDDSTLFKVKNGSYQIIRIDRQECYRFWAATESTTETRLCIKAGEEYFLQCGVDMGAFIGRPRITLVDKPLGRSETEKLRKNSETE